MCKLAICHDFNRYYKDTLYVKTCGVVNYSHEERKSKVLEFKEENNGIYEDLIPMNSSLMKSI